MTMLKMDPLTECLTVNNMNSKKHVNLVQVKKIKMENASTISLDIIAGKCDEGNSLFLLYKFSKLFSKCVFSFEQT